MYMLKLTSEPNANEPFSTFLSGPRVYIVLNSVHVFCFKGETKVHIRVGHTDNIKYVEIWPSKRFINLDVVKLMDLLL